MVLTDAERKAVADAIRRSETRTSGEIFCILNDADAYYPQVALAWAAAIALLVPYLLWLAGVDVGMLMHPGWRSGHGVDTATIAYHRFGFAYTVLPIGLFMLTYVLVSVPPLSWRLTPQRVRRAHVHRVALQQFLAKGLQATKERTGVLIYVSLSDRRAEIVADEAIYTKVSPEAWGDATALVVAGIKRGQIAAGLIEAIEMVADVLAEHFPPRPGNPNELRDEVIEL